MNLTAILKAFGIKVPPEVIKQIEAMIPQIPGKTNQAIAKLNDFDARLLRMEAKQDLIFSMLEELHERYDDIDIRRAGIGATQRELERVGSGE